MKYLEGHITRVLLIYFIHSRQDRNLKRSEKWQSKAKNEKQIQALIPPDCVFTHLCFHKTNTSPRTRETPNARVHTSESIFNYPVHTKILNASTRSNMQKFSSRITTCRIRKRSSTGFKKYRVRSNNFRQTQKQLSIRK